MGVQVVRKHLTPTIWNFRYTLFKITTVETYEIKRDGHRFSMSHEREK